MMWVVTMMALFLQEGLSRHQSSLFQETGGEGGGLTEDGDGRREDDELLYSIDQVRVSP